MPAEGPSRVACDEFGEEFLTLQIDGAAGTTPPSLMLIYRPRHGRVRVREWPDGRWTGDAEERELGTAELLDRVHRAEHEGRRLSEDVSVVERWLAARGG